VAAGVGGTFGAGAAQTGPFKQKASKGRLKSRDSIFMVFSSGLSKSSLVLKLSWEDDQKWV
jgi:hypothetical protein